MLYQMKGLFNNCSVPVSNVSVIHDKDNHDICVSYFDIYIGCNFTYLFINNCSVLVGKISVIHYKDNPDVHITMTLTPQ